MESKNVELCVDSEDEETIELRAGDIIEYYGDNFGFGNPDGFKKRQIREIEGTGGDIKVTMANNDVLDYMTMVRRVSPHDGKHWKHFWGLQYVRVLPPTKGLIVPNPDAKLMAEICKKQVNDKLESLRDSSERMFLDFVRNPCRDTANVDSDSNDEEELTLSDLAKRQACDAKAADDKLGGGNDCVGYGSHQSRNDTSTSDRAAVASNDNDEGDAAADELGGGGEQGGDRSGDDDDYVKQNNNGTGNTATKKETECLSIARSQLSTNVPDLIAEFDMREPHKHELQEHFMHMSWCNERSVYVDPSPSAIKLGAP